MSAGSASPLKICVVTGSRAEYGLLLPLMKLIDRDRSTRLQLMVTGMHLSPEFGLTYKQIEKDGFNILDKVDMLLSGDSEAAIIKAMGLGMIGFADAFQRRRPDWLVLLGDRFETFAAATAAHLSRIPIAHLHGGELTAGATDDAMRHAISKMSYLHFTSTETYRKRVIQLGEDPKRVFNVGAIALDGIDQLNLRSKKELEKTLDFVFGDNTILVTFHPVTLENNSANAQFEALLRALDKFPEMRFLFTLPNADANGRAIIHAIHEYVRKNPGRTRAFASLGKINYLSALKCVRAVIGNSSSGLIEVPHFKIPTVNIGDRQKGRLSPASVIDSKNDSKNIIAAINKSLSPAFAAASRKIKNPYEKKGTAGKIFQIIKKNDRQLSLKKPFYDLQP